MDFLLVAQFQTELIESDTGPNIARWIILAVVAVTVVALVYYALELVHEKTAVVVERLGKFHRIMGPGLHAIIPFIDRAVDEVSLQIQQFKADVQVKTRDNVFVRLPVTIQYRVQEAKVREAYYELEDPEGAIEALVLNEVKSISANMELEDVFSSRDRVQQAVQQSLQNELGGYGYQIINAVVDNPQLSGELEASFNSVMAAQRAQDAATMQAEATRIQMVGEATAEAASLEIKAKAISNFRNTIAAGNAAAITTMVEGTDLTGRSALEYFMVTDSNDAIRDAAGKGATIVVATPNANDGLYASLNGSLADRTAKAQ